MNSFPQPLDVRNYFIGIFVLIVVCNLGVRYLVRYLRNQKWELKIDFWAARYSFGTEVTWALSLYCKKSIANGNLSIFLVCEEVIGRGRWRKEIYSEKQNLETNISCPAEYRNNYNFIFTLPTPEEFNKIKHPYLEKLQNLGNDQIKMFWSTLENMTNNPMNNRRYHWSIKVCLDNEWLNLLEKKEMPIAW